MAYQWLQHEWNHSSCGLVRFSQRFRRSLVHNIPKPNHACPRWWSPSPWQWREEQTENVPTHGPFKSNICWSVGSSHVLSVYSDCLSRDERLWDLQKRGSSSRDRRGWWVFIFVKFVHFFPKCRIELNEYIRAFFIQTPKAVISVLRRHPKYSGASSTITGLPRKKAGGRKVLTC